MCADSGLTIFLVPHAPPSHLHPHPQENRHQKETASHLQQEADRLRADNVKLYEKIKFLQSYPSSSRQPASLEDETTGRYASQYEARLDPFSAFGQKVGGA